MDNFKFKPLSNYIVLDVVERKARKIGSLYEPETVKKSMLDATVVCISEEMNNEGKPMVKNIKVGDKVIFDVMGSFSMVLEGKGYLIIRETQVIGITYEEFDEVESDNSPAIFQLPTKVN